ncbi:hypothetical protein [Pedobacter sp. Hv1]|uniref:hypothetical protein n=1 Tax=Pedobacter sp. Hv1 TaxID=1740090 RepID=UPI0006D8B76E|nr:hypothetical protein [Pedobacter sp. Hv1]KQB99841.1 hypothetical protein AQF98_15100 [Pedobacter sp. Hv1]
MRTELDIHQVNATIAELKRLDLKTATRDQIYQLLSRLYGHIGVTRKLEKGRFVQRGVFIGSEEDFPKEVQRISFNPKGSAMGRCNFDGNSMFYGCISSNVLEGYINCGFELLPLSNEEVKDLPPIREHRVIVGNWILSEETEFVSIGSRSYLTHLNTDVQHRNELFYKIISPYQQSMLSFYAIDKFIADEFSKPVPKNEPWLYKISATYVDMIKANGHKGLIYPSVKSNGAGMNIIIFPEFVTNGLITFERCVYGIFYVREKEVGNEWLMKAKANDGKLVWKDEYGRMPTPLRNFYKGISDINPAEGKIKMLDLGNSPS